MYVCYVYFNKDQSINQSEWYSGKNESFEVAPFNEEKYDVNAYSTRFERACVAFEVKTAH